MKSTALFVVVVSLWSSYTQSYSPSFIPRNLGSSTFLSRSSVHQKALPPAFIARSRLSMFSETTSGGMEQLQEYLDTQKAVTAATKNPTSTVPLYKLASLATVPLSAALGFVSVPSRRFAAHAVGAVATGLAGAVGKSRLDDWFTTTNAEPAIVQALVDQGVTPATKKAIQAIQEQFVDLTAEDFTALNVHVYAMYLVGMVRYDPQARTTELKELATLKDILGLANEKDEKNSMLHVGQAHAMAAKEWYRLACLQTDPQEWMDDDDDEDDAKKQHPDRLAMQKLLFLTERALKQGGETKEAFRFEMTRVAKAVGLDSLGQAMEFVAATVEPFYQRALLTVRTKLSSDSGSTAFAKTLKKARNTLGIDESTAFDMHVAAFNAEIRDLLAAEDEEDQSSFIFGEEDLERLQNLKEILGLSDTDAEYEIASEVTPLYQATALSAMKDVLAKEMTPDEAWEIMDERRDELLLSEDSTKSLVSSMIMQALGGPLEETNKFGKVNNEAATFTKLLEALEAKQALIAILGKSGWEEFDKFDETFCNPWDKQSANGFLMSEDRIKLYRIFLNRSMLNSGTGKLTDEMYDKIMQVKGLLGITDQQAEIETRTIFGKKLKDALKQAMSEIVEDFTQELADNMQAKVDEIMDAYRLSDHYLRETGATFYAKAVELISYKSPNGIPTDEMITALGALRDICKLTVEETYPAHIEFFGSVYRKSVLEAMGQTGIIREEFRTALEELQGRLGVSPESTEALFLEAVEDKMRPMMEWVGSEMERTLLTQKQLSQRRKKDMGEDVFQTGKGADGVLGLGAEVNIMSDIMELVDFYNENKISKQKTVEGKGDDDEAKTETVYPLTALGMGAIDQELAELLYRQFIVGAFQSQGETAARYENSRDTFAGILGLSEAKKEEVSKTIGGTVYENFISNALKTKGTMDQQDMLVLGNIQGKLGLSSDQNQKMILQTQRKILTEELEVIMDDPKPETVKTFREKCNSMGLDLTEDVGVSRNRLQRMFESEIVPGLKSGDISGDSSDVLTEIQESLGLEAEDCDTMFEEVLGTLAKNAYTLVRGEIMRGREENTVEPIKQLVRFAEFTGGDLGLTVEEATGNKVVSIYDSFDFEGEDEESVEEKKELLAAAMGL